MVLVLPLTHAQACEPEVAGAKAANLARCANAGLPTLPGLVITTEATARGLDEPEVRSALRNAWEELAGEAPLVVRSSSTIEDAGTSSMAGRFTSVLDVEGWEGFVAAVRTVVASADAVRDTDGVAQPIAVLVQPQLDTELGGVMFGVDPVTGDRDHLVVEAVAARPDVLVSGAAVADHYVLTHRGRVVAHTSIGDAVELPLRVRQTLARLATRAAAEFGSPQDMEWAVGGDGRVWVLQSRPVTAVAARAPATHAVTLGPGPLAETFPDPLRPLERDLWLEPVRTGMVRALRATAAVGDRAIARSPVATTIGGRVAVDLGLLGADTAAWRRRARPSAIGRRLASAWRVGRLRVALPRLATAVVDAVDADLAEIGDPRADRTTELMDLLRRSVDELATVHAYEMLCGMLLRPGDPGADGMSVALLALERLGEVRSAGVIDDARAVALAPELLALMPPGIGATRRLPVSVDGGVGGPAGDAEVAPTGGVGGAGLDDLTLRDSLRLRVRWLQELQSRLVLELGARLAETGALRNALDVVHLTLDEVAGVAVGRPVPVDLAARMARPAGAPLPASARCVVDMTGVIDAAGVVDERSGERGGEPRRGRDRHRAAGSGTAVRLAGAPAGGGRSTGRVVHDVVPGFGTPVVLVTEHLGPDLAVLLPQLAGLVAETGSALSHVAILARELGVPTVAGVAGARAVLVPGSTVAVDGTAGTVTVLAGPADAPDDGPCDEANDRPFGPSSERSVTA